MWYEVVESRWRPIVHLSRRESYPHIAISPAPWVNDVTAAGAGCKKDGYFYCLYDYFRDRREIIWLETVIPSDM